MNPRNPIVVASELALVAVSVATVAGMSRLFLDGSYFPRVVFLTVAAHLLAMLVRRLHRGVTVSAVVSAVGFFVLTSAVYYSSTTRFGLPTWATRDAAADDLRAAWDIFSVERAPVVPHVGFLVAAGAAMWVCAFLADWAAFRLVSPIEAAAPAAVVFVFSSVFAADQHQVASTGVFVAAILLFFLTHRTARHDSGASWLGGTAREGNGVLLRTGLGLAMSALAVGLLAGPLIPGARAEPVLDWRDLDNGPGSRSAISPLVDIRSRLVDLGDEEVMRVRSPRPDYWRLTSLDRFDGVQWKLNGRFADAAGQLASDVPPAVPRDLVVQEFSIVGLRQIWLPAAYEPSRLLDDAGVEVQYEPRSGTLILEADGETSDGLTYRIESAVPTRSRDAIAAGAASPIPDEVIEGYLDLPGDYSELARATALDIVTAAGATTPYDQALALQSHFQAYTYDLDVAIGHSNDDIDGFLENRRGYCEQFAGTFASMARSLGIPARVAVGFTWGDPVPGDPTLFVVRGKHAHAWPEVYLAGVGWVRFEPTPGRGAPGDTAVTGLPPAQDAAAAAPEPATTTTIPGGPTTTRPSNVPADEFVIPEATGGGTGGDRGGGDSRLGTLGWIAGGLTVAAATVGAGIAGLKLVARRRRREQLGHGPRADIARAWTRSGEDLELLSIARRPAETPVEFATRVEPDLGEAGPALLHLAGATTAAGYGGEDPDPAAVHAATQAADAVRRLVHQRVRWHQRLRWWLDPRPLARPLRLRSLADRVLREA